LPLVPHASSCLVPHVDNLKAAALCFMVLSTEGGSHLCGPCVCLLESSSLHLGLQLLVLGVDARRRGVEEPAAAAAAAAAAAKDFVRAT
jgi:hypothetical protein